MKPWKASSLWCKWFVSQRSFRHSKSAHYESAFKRFQKEVAQHAQLLRHLRSKSDPGGGKPNGSFSSSHRVFLFEAPYNRAN